MADAGAAARRRDALAERLLAMNVHAYEVAAIYLGDRLGFYAALAADGPATSADLARRAGADERYVREWLEQQAVAGVLDADDAAAPAESRRYSLPAGHEEVLVDRDSLAYLAPLARFTVGVFEGVPDLLDAYRDGRGVDYARYGDDARVGQADVNRTMFVNLLGREWFPALTDVDARLRAEPPARVADLGCGLGWSSIAIAKAYPLVRVEGYDSDKASVEIARRNAEEAGVADRVTFEARDAADPRAPGRYDLVTIFEALHDMGRPVEALRTARRMLAPGGSVLVADERVPDAFAAPGTLSDRLFYGWSVLFCLPTGRADAPSVATGAVMRPATLARYAEEAGFARVEIAPVEHDLWRFYRLHA